MEINVEPAAPANQWEDETREIVVREAASDRAFAALIAEVSAAELETDAVVAVLRRRGHRPLLVPHDPVDALPPEVASHLAERVLGAAFDDDAIARVCADALPGRMLARHAVAFDDRGVAVALVAAFTTGAMSSERPRTGVLRRGADALAAWVGVPVQQVDAAQSLLDLAGDCALVHHRGVIVMANAAAARVLGAPSPDRLVGRDLASYVEMAPTRFGAMLTEVRAEDGRRRPATLRSVPISVGGRERHALLVRCTPGDPPPRPIPLRPSMERAFCDLHPLLHESTRLTLAVDDRAEVCADEAAIVRLTTAMLLDAACFLDRGGETDNHLAVMVDAEDRWISIEMIAQATAMTLPGAGVETLGMEIARDVLRALGGEIRAELTPSRRRRRVVAMLPRAGRETVTP